MVLLQILFGIAFVVCAFIWFYYAANALLNLKPGNGWLVFFPVWLFMPSVFTALGNRFRVKALKVMLIMLVLMGFVVMIG